MIQSLPDRLETALRNLVQSDEPVRFKIKGAWKEGLVCTDTRVIILKAGFMTGQTFGANVFQLSYESIAGVQVTFHLLSGYFEISASGMQNEPKSYWSKNTRLDPAKAPNCIALNNRQQAQYFREACTFILAQASAARTNAGVQPNRGAAVQQERPQDNILKAIESLGELKTKGIITEAEFLAKKTDLLSRL